jgi:hypothetical protein
LLERAPRIRLSAEAMRDQALCISGLLCTKMYGPSVMPWEPAGIWQSPWNDQTWVTSKGDDQYRRSLYTYWKRTAAYPSTLMFDGADREVCTARRIRTNTPLQALVTLNDSVYLDAARHFAGRMQQSSLQEETTKQPSLGEGTTKQRSFRGGTTKQSAITTLISNGYTCMLYKPIEPAKLAALQNLYNTAYLQYKNNAAGTCEITGGMNAQSNAETAALIVVANAMLNLDEVITKN